MVFPSNWVRLWSWKDCLCVVRCDGQHVLTLRIHLRSYSKFIYSGKSFPAIIVFVIYAIRFRMSAGIGFNRQQEAASRLYRRTQQFKLLVMSLSACVRASAAASLWRKLSWTPPWQTRRDCAMCVRHKVRITSFFGLVVVWVCVVVRPRSPWWYNNVCWRLALADSDCVCAHTSALDRVCSLWHHQRAAYMYIYIHVYRYMVVYVIHDGPVPPRGWCDLICVVTAVNAAHTSRKYAAHGGAVAIMAPNIHRLDA